MNKHPRNRFRMLKMFANLDLKLWKNETVNDKN